MTPLNTIIEEEKKLLDERFKNNVYLTVPTEMDVKIADVKDFLTTAMQRAYEVGREGEMKIIKIRIDYDRRKGIPAEETVNDIYDSIELKDHSELDQDKK